MVMIRVTAIVRQAHCQARRATSAGERTLMASGSTARIDYDHTDCWNNPSGGSRTQFAVTRDWSGEEKGDTEWTQIELQ